VRKIKEDAGNSMSSRKIKEGEGNSSRKIKEGEGNSSRKIKEGNSNSSRKIKEGNSSRKIKEGNSSSSSTTPPLLVPAVHQVPVGGATAGVRHVCNRRRETCVQQQA